VVELYQTEVIQEEMDLMQQVMVLVAVALVVIIHQTELVVMEAVG
jgi:hypothetical protein